MTFSCNNVCDDFLYENSNFQCFSLGCYIFIRVSQLGPKKVICIYYKVGIATYPICQRTQSFPITSDRSDMSGKTEVGPTKYPSTSDLQSGYFLVSFVFLSFFWSHKVRIGH